MKKVIIIGIVLVALCIGGLVIYNSSFDGEDNNIQYVGNKKETYELRLRLSYSGADITPGKSFDPSDIDEKAKVSTIKSCAFDGQDHVYTYKNVEITTNIGRNVEKIYSVYFIDPTISTPEGIRIGSFKDSVIMKLGDDYVETNGTLRYEGNGVIALFEIVNDQVFSIEYQMSLE